MNAGERRVSIDVVGASAVDVFTSFAGVLGVEAEVDPELTAKLDLRIDRVSVLTAIRAACESLGCGWSLLAEPSPGRLVVRPIGSPAILGSADNLARLASRHPAMQEPVALELRDAELAPVANTFGKIMHAKIELEPDVVGVRVSMQVHNRPAWRVLQAICSGANLRVDVVSEEPLSLRIARDPAVSGSPPK